VGLGRAKVALSVNWGRVYTGAGLRRTADFQCVPTLRLLLCTVAPDALRLPIGAVGSTTLSYPKSV
jgi:hypothetical protein